MARAGPNGLALSDSRAELEFATGIDRSTLRGAKAKGTKGSTSKKKRAVKSDGRATGKTAGRTLGKGKKRKAESSQVLELESELEVKARALKKRRVADLKAELGRGGRTTVGLKATLLERLAAVTDLSCLVH